MASTLLLAGTAQPAAAASNVNGPISRLEVVQRAQDWVNRRVPYSKSSTTTDVTGATRYRQDCSGMVSMAWHLSGPGLSTSTLGSVSTPLANLDQLVYGDILLRAGEHVMLFNGWTDASHTKAFIYEEMRPDTVAHSTTYLRSTLDKYQPRRYNKITDDGGSAQQAAGRVVVVDNGNAYAKEGSLDAGWVLLMTDARNVVADGNRIAVLKPNGDLYVKEGSLNASWVLEFRGATSFDISGDRIGVVDGSGKAWVKDGSLNEAWVIQRDNASSVVLDADRIGVLGRDGNAFVKDGSLYETWTHVFAGARQLALGGGRIGVIDNAGDAYVKEGSLNALWDREINGNIRLLVLSGNRIGVIDGAGNVQVKEGALNAGWTVQMYGSRWLSMAGNRIAVIDGAGNAQAKEGSLNAGWIVERTGGGNYILSVS